jgi:hypothetical protein
MRSTIPRIPGAPEFSGGGSPLAQEQAPALGGSTQVALVESQLPARQLGPFVGSQAAPTAGRSTQVPLVTSQLAYVTQLCVELAQGLPTASGGRQVAVVVSQWSAALAQSYE